MKSCNDRTVSGRAMRLTSVALLASLFGTTGVAAEVLQITTPNTQKTIDGPLHGDFEAGVTIDAEGVTVINNSTITATDSKAIFGADVNNVKVINNGTVKVLEGGGYDAINIISDNGEFINYGTVESPKRSAITVKGNNFIAKNYGTLTGRYGLSGDESYNQVLENHGTIDTVRYGMDSFGYGGVRLNNYGTIKSNTGILFQTEEGYVTNAGRIDAGTGIYIEGYGNTITNSGTITARTVGIDNTQDYDNIIINSGRIDADTGISLAYSGHVITNSGTIAARTVGIDSTQGYDSSIINSGRIDADTGISFASSGHVITNRGTIAARTVGIKSSGTGGNTVTNSGRISVENPLTNRAVDLVGNNNKLVLKEGSVISGQINFEGSRNTLQLDKGFSGAVSYRGVFEGGAPVGEFLITSSEVPRASVATELSFDAAAETGLNQITPVLLSVPVEIVGSDQLIVHEDGVLYAFSKSGIGKVADAAPQVTHELTRGIFTDLDNRVNSQRNCKGAACEGGFWSASGAQVSSQSEGAKFETTLLRSLIGYDVALGEDRLAGLFGGYSRGVARTGADSQGKQASAFLGSYYSASFGNVFSTLGVLGGYSWIDQERDFANNLLASGLEKLTGNTTGYYVSPSLTLGYDLGFDKFRLTPSVQTRFTHYNVKGYSEKGRSSLTFADQQGQRLDVRTQLSAALLSGGAPRIVNANVRAGVDLYQNWGGNALAIFDRSRVALTSSTEENGARGFVGTDFTVKVSDGFAVRADAEAGYDTAKVVSAKVSLGGSLKF